MIIWEIHYQILGIPGEGVCHKRYQRKGVAKRIAKQLFGDDARFKWWLVGKTPILGRAKFVEKG